MGQQEPSILAKGHQPIGTCQVHREIGAPSKIVDIVPREISTSTISTSGSHKGPGEAGCAHIQQSSKVKSHKTWPEMTGITGD